MTAITAEALLADLRADAKLARIGAGEDHPTAPYYGGRADAFEEAADALRLATFTADDIAQVAADLSDEAADAYAWGADNPGGEGADYYVGRSEAFTEAAQAVDALLAHLVAAGGIK